MKTSCRSLTLACFLLAYCFGGVPAVGQQTPDRDFKVTVADPAYKNKNTHPKVLFDEAHYNVHTTQGSYKTFVDLITSDGYRVTANDKPFESKVLAGYDILVISNARGAQRPSELPAFTDAECDAVRDWVQQGGALLLVTDHYPTGHAAEKLSQRFGVDMSKGTTTDPAHAPPGTAGGVLLFTRDEKLLGDHPIMQGRNESERLNRVATFAGQSLKGPEGSVALLKFSDTAVDRLPNGAGAGAGPSGPGPAGRGGAKGRRPLAADPNVPTVSAAGRSQGVALKFGQGRVVVLGEASQISAQQAGPQQRPMGMNYPDCDNRQWTLNIVHWLSGLLDPPAKAAEQSTLQQQESPPAAKAAAPVAQRPPQPEIQLMLHVHCLKSDVPEVNAEADEAALKKMVEGVNAIFAPAGIRFTLEGVTRDAARDETAQRELAELSNKRGREVADKFTAAMMRIVPEIPVHKGVFHIVIVHRFPLGMGGRYFPEAGYLVTPQVVPRPPQMPAGDDDIHGEHPLEPKVMAHELGHGLTLLHVNISKNLMTLGMGPQDPKTWIELTDWQIEKARKAAEKGLPLLRGDPLNPHAEEKAAAMAGPPGGRRTPSSPPSAVPRGPQAAGRSVSAMPVPATESSGPSTPTVIPADAWPSFRGRSASGVADGQNPPTTWNIAEGVQGQWKTPIPGLANSSPIAWGDRVFLTTAIASEPPSPSKVRPSNPAQAGALPVEDQSKHTWCVYCLSLGDGKVVWQQTAHEGEPHVKRHAKSSFANATPVTDGRHVVAFFGSEGLYCYDFNGQLLWKQDLGVIDAAAFRTPSIQWGPASSPIIYDDLVIVQCDQPQDSFVAAYRLATGKLVWRTPRDELSSWSTPAICQGNGRTDLVTLSPNFCRGYDPRTGQQRWQLGGFSKITVPTPIMAHGLIFVCSGYPPPQPIFAVRPGASGDISPGEKSENSPDGALAWHVDRGGPYVPTPIIYGEHLYVLRNTGALACYEARTGKEVYQTRVEGKGGYSASPVAADGRLYFTSENGDISVVKAGPTFELLATNVMGDRCLATPAISRGKLLIRTEHALYGVGEQTVSQPSLAAPTESKSRAPESMKESPSAAARVPPSPNPRPNQTPTLLTGPADWGFERMPVPPRFAPDIKLSGFEEARFAPGMFDTGASDYFTYILALSVDGTEAIDAAAIKDFLDKYYKGLSAGVGRRKQLSPDLSQIIAVVTPAQSGAGAGDNYKAKVTYFDTFSDGRKIELNAEIKVLAKPAAKKTFITLLISPQPPAAKVWGKLHEIEKTIALEGP